MREPKTPRPSADAERLRREATLETALEAADLAAWELDLGTDTVLLDDRAAAVIGIADRRRGRYDLGAMVSAEDRDSVVKALQDHLEGRAPAFQATFRFTPDEGPTRWLVARGRALLLGDSLRVIGTVHDASHERQRELLVRRLLDTASVTGHAFFEALVASLSEVTGATRTAIAELVGPDSVRTVARWVHGSLQPNIGYRLKDTPCEDVLTAHECHFPDRAAERFPKDEGLRTMEIASYVGVPLRTAAGTAIGLLHAMSEKPMPDPALLDRVRLFAARAAAELERLQSERALRTAELRFRALLEGLNEAVLLTDCDGFALYTNPQFGTTTGFELDDLGGRPAHEILFEAEEWPAMRQRLDRRFAGEQEQYVTDLVRRDGGHIWISVRESPFRDESGKVVGILAAMEDITEQVRGEALVREAHEELEGRVRARTAELQAMNRELESFSYSVSHDLRAPLRTINGFGKILQEEHAEALGEEGRDHLRRIVDATRRMGQLIDDLLDLSRTSLHTLQRREIGLSEVAGRIAERLSASEPDRNVAWHIEPHLSADADPTLIAVLLENLLGNAWKFTRFVATASIALGRQQDGAYYVRDNGAGFDMAFQERLFQPFQRLHDARLFEGSGIGLATVQRVANRHGGTTWAEGAPDQGATFYFTLG